MKAFFRNNSLKFVKLITGAACFATITLCTLQIAQSVSNNAITVARTSGSITVNGNSISGLTVTPAVVFNKTGDAITYKVSLSNPDKRDFKIKNVSDDNKNQYIATSYQYDKNMNADPKALYFTLTYKSYLNFGSNLNLNDIHISVDIDEAAQAANSTTTTSTTKPSTSSTSSTSKPSASTASTTKPTTSSTATSTEPANNQVTTSEPTTSTTTAPATTTPVAAKKPAATTSETTTVTTTTTTTTTETTPTTETVSPAEAVSSNDATSSTDVGAPDTGSYAEKFVGGEETGEAHNIMPYVLVMTASFAVIVLVVLPKAYRAWLGVTIVLIFSFAFGGLINTQVYAASNVKSSTLRLTINTSKITALPDPSKTQNVVSVVFPNIYNAAGVDDLSTWGNTILIKTLDNKYVLMDTGQSATGTVQMVYNKLKELQKTSNVAIDYMIISHLDGDHFGNANAIMSHANIRVKNLLLKHEVYENKPGKEKTFQSLAQTAFRNNVNIITNGDANTAKYITSLTGKTNYDKVSEGMTIQVGKYLKLNVFNTSNVYAGKSCPDGEGISWTADISNANLFKNSKGEYVYFDGSKYPSVTYKTTTKLAKKVDSKGNATTGINRYFYAAKNTHNICQSNPNAFGVLAEVTTTGLSKYMYFPGDIENAGVSFMNVGGNSSELYKNVDFKNGKFVNNVTPYQIASETNTANSIYNKLSADAKSLGVSVNTLLNNITIYQMSHHGINNNADAMNKLNLNRSSGIYAIQEGPGNMTNANSWSYVRTYWYTLGKIPAKNKIRVGVASQKGVNCNITTFGDTSCLAY